MKIQTKEVVTLSNFDELFNSISNMGLSSLSDSSIKLVTQYDYPYLKTGEYFYDEENNILYVGAGNVADIYDVLKFIDRFTSFKLIESPKVKVNVEVEDNIERAFSITIKETPKISSEVIVNIEPSLSVSFRLPGKKYYNLYNEKGIDDFNIERSVIING